METGEENGVRITARRYLAFVEEGLISCDEHVELLEGIIVAMPPSAPPHAQGVRRVERVLRRALGPDAILSVQLPLLAGSWSVPEPDVAVLRGNFEDYETAHPISALLVVEVSSHTVAQDRLTKSIIYAAAGVSHYWIVNLRDGVVEWFSDPDALARVYRSQGVARGDDELVMAGPVRVRVRASDLLPPS
jgi:Uma2 family endonuclease